MNRRQSSPDRTARVTIRVSGKLYQGHLSALEQLVRTARECWLWPQLNLAHLEELDRAALVYLIDGEHHDFEIVCCPKFIRDWMDFERERSVA